MKNPLTLISIALVPIALTQNTLIMAIALLAWAIFIINHIHQPKEKKIEVEVCERLFDYWHDWNNNGKRMPKYHAQIKGEPGLWACGRHPDDAVGDLIVHHQEEFNVRVNYLKGKIAR